MTELATAWVTLAVNAKGMQGDIRRAFGEVDTDAQGRKAGQQYSRAAVASTNLTGIERKLADVGRKGAAHLSSALKKGMIGATAAVSGAIGTSLALGFKRLSAIDDAQAKLRGLGNDAATVSKVMDNAIASVKGTAFGLGDAAGLAGVIVASGIKPGRELETTLKRVADSAAISGSSLGEMGSIWAKTAAKGKLDGEIVAQLLERQIPIYDILAKKLGVNASEVAKMVTKGKVSFQDFSDAMNDKLAGSALKTGETVRGAFDNMKAAMGRMGAAALEPGFKTLPGIFTGLTKAIDDATPRVKEFSIEISGRAQAAIRQWVPQVKEAWATLRDNKDVRENLQQVWRTLQLVGSAGRALLPPILQIGRSLGQASKSLGISTWQILLAALQGAAGAANALAAPLRVLADLMEKHQGVVTATAAAYLAFRGIPALLGKITPVLNPMTNALKSVGTATKAGVTGAGELGRAWATSIGWIRQSNPGISTAAANLKVLQVNASAAARGGLNMVRGAASGVIGALGGPFSAALMAAGAAFMYISSQNQKAEQGLRGYQSALKRTQDAQVALNNELMRARGASTEDSVVDAMADRVRAMGEELDAAGQKTGSFLDQFRDADRSLAGGFRKQFFNLSGSNADNNLKFKIDQQAEAARNAKGVLDDLKMSQQDLAGVMFGGQAAFDQLTERLNASGEAGRDLAAKMNEARSAYQTTQRVAQQAAPGIMDMADAMKVLSDNTASAADKTKALTNALTALNPERAKGDAIEHHDEVLSQVTESTQQATDQTQGFGQALLAAGGNIDTATRNGQALRATLKDLVDASAGAVASGQSLDEVNRKNAEAIGQLATQYGLTVEQIRAAYDQLGGRDLNLLITTSGGPEVIQAFGLVGRAFEAVPDQKEITIKADQIAGSEQAIEQLGFKVEQIDGMPGTVRIRADTDDAQSRLHDLMQMLTGGGIPQDVPIKVTDDGGQAMLDLLKSLGVQVKTDNEKNIKVEAPLGENVKKLLADLGYEVRTNNDKTIQVKLVGVDEARRTLTNLTSPGAVNVPVPGRLHGAIVPMANGGLRHIVKPSSADIYAGRGAGTIFAEQATGGEAYIPLAPSKRGRSTLILSEVASRFGYRITPMEDGGITVDEFKRFASSIAGRRYVWGAGNGDTFDTDCSGAQSFLANYATGGSGRFSTASESAALLSRGFQQGDPPAGVAAYWIGWDVGGPGGGHTAGTIVDPYGGNINVEMGGRAGNGQFGGSAAGAADFSNRAWVALAAGDDPESGGSFSAKQRQAVQRASASVTSARAGVTSAQAGVESAQQNVASLQAKGASADKIATAEKKKDAAEQRLTAAQERLAIAEGKLTDAQQMQEVKGGKASGGQGGQNLGQAFMSGILQTLGLDGSLFSNPLEWPNVKSAMALLNWGGGMMRGMMGGGQGDGGMLGGTGGAGFDLGGIAGGLTQGMGIGNLIGTNAIGPTTVADPNAHGGAWGAAPGPLVQYNGPVNMGTDPTAFQQKQSAHMNMALRGQMVQR